MENNKTFSIGKESFLLNGEPFTIVSGAIHYFRVPREYWRDRLLKLKACGFNTVETYVAWNCHQKNEDAFDFSGNNNLEEFLDLAENQSGYIKAMWCGETACEEEIKDITGGVKSRCIPFVQDQLSDVCACCGKPAKHMVVWGRQY